MSGKKGAVFRGTNGLLYMIRCPKCHAENYAPSVAHGYCAWCGYVAEDQDVNILDTPKEYKE